MGPGRAKAKQTKVPRNLKYRTNETDFNALARELHGEKNTDVVDEVDDDYDDPWADYRSPRRD